MSIICPSCGAELEEGQAFCGFCGTKYTPPAPVVPDVPMASVCANCGTEMTPGQAFCGTCGTPAAMASTAPQLFHCANCGTEMAPDQAFCPVCGTKATATMTPGVQGAINQFNANIETKKKKKPLVPIIIGAVVVVLVLIIALAGGGKKNFGKIFSDIKYNSWCTISSDGKTMTIDTNPNDEYNYIDLIAYYTIEDINAELGFPSYVYDDMGDTTSSDGVQSASTDSVYATWTFSSDTGLEVIYTFK